ncbi:RdgB/HAM1 family non-canonical purine NTP pyrophosphatase [bacterium]|nr:RdgB/HAM1 family non-canonical purine NTP pyrophosphatase [bacterium]
MNRPVVFATGNSGKLCDARRALAGLPFTVFSPAEYVEQCGCGGEPPEVEETGSTYEANAELKARAISSWVRAVTGEVVPIFADDSGLEVEALGGAPGLYSARYAGEGCTFDDNIQKLLCALEGQKNRQARFLAVLALVVPSGDEESSQPSVKFFRGDLLGEVTLAPRGSGGFGYDPIFEVSGKGKTLAELKEGTASPETHRTRALSELFGDPLFGGA